MPHFNIIDSPALNAFAMGLTKTYSITLTRGIVEAPEPEELNAVIAHELTHHEPGCKADDGGYYLSEFQLSGRGHVSPLLYGRYTAMTIW